ncbi:MAG: tetratricopeptide repeat protein [Betaproteobacteria bacterium]|nr:tetratricopeptide repeat protein [Betaproteobacteria bacterium]
MGEKRRRLAAAHQAPVLDGRSIERAFHALRAGDRAGAAAMLDAIEPGLPRDAQALHAAGVLALQLGQASRAEPLLRRAVEIDARDPALRGHLAIACRRMGRVDRAIAELDAALAIDPTLPELHANLGMALLDRGDFAAAHASFARALAIRRDFPDALNGRGNAALALGDAAGARADFARAVALDPRFHEAHYNLSRAALRLAAGEGSTTAAARLDALASIVAALDIDGSSDAYWVQLEVAARDLDLGYTADSRVHEALFRALGHPAVDPARMARPVASLLALHPAAIALQGALAEAATFDAGSWQAARHHARALFGLPLAQRLLEEAIVPHAALQRLVAATRGALLAGWTEAPEAEPALPLAATAAIAQQGFNTEYVSAEPALEGDGVAALAGAIARVRAGRGSVPLHWYALFGCYRPLHALDDAQAIAAELASTPLARLAQRQIAEPAEERRIAAAIPALTAIGGGVSALVREQYEANPYPRWQRLRTSSAPASIGDFLRRLFPHATLDGAPAGPASVLVAGCGTGRQSLESARRFLVARLLAFDLSLASLAYAIRKARELGVAGIDYRQADLTELGALDERFDLVECSGVLHHLADPLAGWRTLRGLVKPGGFMRIGLYSETARRHVVRARELIAELGLGSTPEGIRACRDAILARRDDPLLARVAQGADFYSLSGCRDLLFHAQETRFTIPQLAAMLDELDLGFVGFEFGDDRVPADYRAEFPGDVALTGLGNWQLFEERRPDTFAQMYQFWARAPA